MALGLDGKIEGLGVSGRPSIEFIKGMDEDWEKSIF